MTSGLAMARGLLVALLYRIASADALAATAAAPVIGGMSSQPELGLPSMTRVILAVVVTLSLAAAAIVLLKRFLPGTAARRTQGGVIKVLARTNVTSSLHAHVLEIDSTRVLIVEGRNGVSLTLLPRTDSNEKSASP
jgi:flagellar biogenesis protein FliO